MTSPDLGTIAAKVFTDHADLFRRLAIRDHHVYTNACVLGFVDREHVPELSDRPIAELVYMARVHRYQHQYLSLCHHDGRFLEAVVEVFYTARHPKAKRGGTERDQQMKGGRTLFAGICRSWEEIEVVVDRTYSLAQTKTPI